MEKNKLYWSLYKEGIDKVEKYCERCKRKVVFYDSLVRRHNANGKNLYQYAIYKCEKGHTWNKILNKYNSSNANEFNFNRISYTSTYLKENDYKREGKEKVSFEKITIEEFKKGNFKDINISVNGNMSIRLDKLLGDNITDVSRSEIQQRIKTGSVLVNGREAKPKYKVNDGDEITIII